MAAAMGGGAEATVLVTAASTAPATIVAVGRIGTAANTAAICGFGCRGKICGVGSVRKRLIRRRIFSSSSRHSLYKTYIPSSVVLGPPLRTHEGIQGYSPASVAFRVSNRAVVVRCPRSDKG